MPVVPKKIPEKIAWFQTREAAWTSNAAAIGLLAPEMVTMSALISTASDALAAHLAARAAAKDATVALYEATRFMGDYGADLIMKIRAKAGQVGGDSVYVLASVPPPAIPTPVGPPGVPTDLKVELNPDGSLVMTFKCVNPANGGGPIYHVYRSMATPDDYEFIGGSGERKFIDSTVPSGSSVVYYKIQAVRTTAIGVAAEFMVRFGVGGAGGSGGIMVSAVEKTAPKIAA